MLGKPLAQPRLAALALAGVALVGTAWNSGAHRSVEVIAVPPKCRSEFTGFRKTYQRAGDSWRAELSAEGACGSELGGPLALQGVSVSVYCRDGSLLAKTHAKTGLYSTFLQKVALGESAGDSDGLSYRTAQLHLGSGRLKRGGQALSLEDQCGRLSTQTDPAKSPREARPRHPRAEASAFAG